MVKRIKNTYFALKEDKVLFPDKKFKMQLNKKNVIDLDATNLDQTQEILQTDASSGLSSVMDTTNKVKKA